MVFLELKYLGGGGRRGSNKDVTILFDYCNQSMKIKKKSCFSHCSGKNIMCHPTSRLRVVQTKDSNH